MRLIAARKAATQGDGVLAPYEPALLELLPRDHETIVTVLDIAETARNLEQRGILRYAWSRGLSLGPFTLARLLPTGLRLGLQLLRLGIAGWGLLLVAAELRQIADRGFRNVALHWQLSDFLVATGDSAWLSRYIGIARSYGLGPGLCSHDLRRAFHLVEQCGGLDFVIAPLSASGFRMTPNREACEVAIRRRRVDVLPHLGSLTALDPKDRDYAETLGFTRFVVDS
jgi:hypothetical protein